VGLDATHINFTLLFNFCLGLTNKAKLHLIFELYNKTQQQFQADGTLFPHLLQAFFVGRNNWGDRTYKQTPLHYGLLISTQRNNHNSFNTTI
jgi:hypothetical protein